MKTLSLRKFGFTVFIMCIVFVLTIAVAYIRINTTLKGYSIGELKDKESMLIQQRSVLKMQLAKLTKKDSLLNLSRQDFDRSNGKKTLASH